MVSPGPVLALVPARGGSKSLPGKNLRLLAGHPLLAFSIAAGRQAGSVARAAGVIATIGVHPASRPRTSGTAAIRAAVRSRDLIGFRLSRDN